MISDKAIIDPSAKIASDVKIGPFSVIGKNVEIAEGTEVSSHAVIKGPCKIGKNNKIYQFSSIGEDCQDKKYEGEDTILIIGDNNSFREGCTIHRGTVQGGGKTVIGNNNLFMAYTHVAHDCILGNNIIFSNNASVAGHVIVHDNATLGGMVGVHQFCSIGEHSFLAGGSIIFKDVLPYVMVHGYPAKVNGLNQVGLERKGFSKDLLYALKQSYKIIFRQNNITKDAVKLLEPMADKFPEINKLINFLQESTRGIIR